MKKGTVKIKFSNGFGNNLFQYCFGRLLAEHHGLNYCHEAIPQLGIKREIYPFNKELKTIKFKAKSNLEAKKFDKDHLQWFSDRYKNCNFDFYSFIFYFEDYRIYKPYLNKINSFFPKIKKTNKKDLILHFRLENRAIQETHYKNAVKPHVYKRVIKDNFNFNELYIVTDSNRWDYVDEKYIKKLQKKYIKRSTLFVSVKKSVKYINNLIDVFSDFKPKIVHHSNMINDFNFIRSFDKIMFKNSTFAWWASVLSNASKVGVFVPWKPDKGKKKSKNLGKTDFNGWFGWGNEQDLMNKLDYM